MGLGEAAFKKAIRSRKYRERSQPAARAKLGFLEKHKDYVLRARNYHRKQDTLKALKDGKHVTAWTEKTKSLPADMLKLMKTQDASYIALQKNRNLKRLKRAEEELAVTEGMRAGPNIRQHIFFAEDEEEKTLLVDQIRRSATRSKLRADDGPEIDPMTADEDGVARPGHNPANVAYSRRKAEVQVRQDRVKQLEKLEYKMKLDTQLLGKGKRKKVGIDEYGFARFKWAPERKK